VRCNNGEPIKRFSFEGRVGVALVPPDDDDMESLDIRKFGAELLRGASYLVPTTLSRKS